MSRGNTVVSMALIKLSVVKLAPTFWGGLAEGIDEGIPGNGPNGGHPRRTWFCI